MDQKLLLEISTHPVKIKGRTVVLGIARDITERKRAKETLQESEKKSSGKSNRSKFA